MVFVNHIIRIFGNHFRCLNDVIFETHFVLRNRIDDRFDSLLLLLFIRLALAWLWVPVEWFRVTIIIVTKFRTTLAFFKVDGFGDVHWRFILFNGFIVTVIKFLDVISGLAFSLNGSFIGLIEVARLVGSSFIIWSFKLNLKIMSKKIYALCVLEVS